MSEKETVAQMLRRLGKNNRKSLCYLCEEILGEEYCKKSNHECKTAWLALADRIEAEQRAIVDAQDGSAHKIMRAWAEQRGYPWADGESITQWLDGRFLRLPLVDGKPLANGMEIEGLDGPVDMFRIFNDGSGSAYGKYGGFLSFPEYDDPDRDSTLHLAKPKALDADGVPVEDDDTVWFARPEDIYGDSSLRGPLKAALLYGKVRVTADDGEEAWPNPCRLTHKEPDTQEKIDADALKYLWEYWNCDDAYCSKCPVLVGGENPKKHYGVRNCSEAKSLDLLRRQRELDERLMGGAE